jgi:hypothetical protein
MLFSIFHFLWETIVHITILNFNVHVHYNFISIALWPSIRASCDDFISLSYHFNPTIVTLHVSIKLHLVQHVIYASIVLDAIEKKRRKIHLTITLDRYYNWNVKWAGNARKLCWIIVNQAQKNFFLLYDISMILVIVTSSLVIAFRQQQKQQEVFIWRGWVDFFSEVQVRFPTHFWFWIRLFFSLFSNSDDEIGSNKWNCCYIPFAYC